MRKYRFPLLFGLVLSFSAVFPGMAANPEDQAYLETIYRETFSFIDELTEPATGLPYDSNRIDRKATSTTNIGFYLASIAAAGETGIISRDEALKKIQKAFASLEKIPQWRGFPVTWADVSTLAQANGPAFSYADHLGNLIASLLAVKKLYPEMALQIEAYLARFDFKPFYDSATKWLKGGYDTQKKNFTIKQPWGTWYHNLAGADTRFLSFYGIAKGDFPREHWEALNWNKEEKYGYSYLEPGWQGGGLFMQYITGIFLDEKNTPAGASAKNFTSAQIAHAQQIQSDVWGWSACEAPWGEYRGWGRITDRVVTPHASILSIEDFPEEVIQNMRALDKLGLRKPTGEKKWGYRDSIDLQSKKNAEVYLMLDQTMIFLSLANYLYDGIIRKSVMSDPTIQRGFGILYPDLRKE
ncbi:MAG TPA: glucoamylase family protein [Candidatus Omnitrophota bacterium]|nr:glucoamylase family protein [Candidatus Omnitrophota bacterium]